jgi:hypothetical protein
MRPACAEVPGPVENLWKVRKGRVGIGDRASWCGNLFFAELHFSPSFGLVEGPVRSPDGPMFHVEQLD